MNAPVKSSSRGLTSLLLVFLCIAAILGLTPAGPGYAATAREIDVSVDVSLERFYKEVKGAAEFAKSAKGMLVLPNVIKGGFVFGAEYGEGAMRVNGKNVDYYSIAAGSFGLQIGAETKDIVIIFMTAEALKGFQASSGWETGVDGNIALIEVGTGGRLDTTTLREPIVAFVFGVKGLMADISLKGSKFTRLQLQK